MAKPKNPPNLWIERFKNARALGLEKGRIPKTFTPAQKHRLYRASKAIDKKEFDSAANKKKGRSGLYYKTSALATKNVAERKALKEAGITVYKGRAIIRHDTRKKISINRKMRESITGKLVTSIDYKFVKGYVGPTKNRVIMGAVLYNEMATIIEQGKMPPPNKYYSLAFEGHAPFNVVVTTPKQLREYMLAFMPKDRNGTAADIMATLWITTF